MIDINPSKPIILYGSNISYFTGKMENYFKIKEIPYQLKSVKYPKFEKIMKEKVGIHQMPAVELPDGRWMTDSTKMIQWFESQISENRLIPKDPLQAFICFLIEDWADEWWWRPAMHYRWYYAKGASFASRHLSEELLSSVPVPLWIKKIYFTRRQRNGYTTGDGITKKNIKQIEENFIILLRNLEVIFKNRPFLFGNRPSIADIGLSGPFFRHFALDPIPLEILRQEAPLVLKWVSTLWSTKVSKCDENYIDGIPNDLEPILKEIGNTYLPYLCENVNAVNSKKKNFDFKTEKIFFKKARFSQYRVWCLDELRKHFDSIPKEYSSLSKQKLMEFGCWEPLWRNKYLPLLDDQEAELPFKADRKMLGVNE